MLHCLDIQHITMQQGTEATIERALSANQRLSPESSLVHSPRLRAVACECYVYSYMYTVNHKKGGSTCVIITLENRDRFL